MSSVVTDFNVDAFYVMFKKKDGSVRNMIGTKNLSFVPLVDHPKTNVKDKKEIVRVYDLINRAWRSVTISEVLNFIPLPLETESK